MDYTMKEIRGFFGEYRYLSNFWICPVEAFDMKGKSAEHNYQAMKSIYPEERSIVLSQPTPGKAKREGQCVTVRSDWDKIKVFIMYVIVQSKFRQNPKLSQKLRQTGDALLVEDNTWGDTFWGVCRGKGSNILGQILMMVRKEMV